MRICRGANNSVTIGVMAATIFANGHLYFQQGLPEWTHLTLPPFAVHANYIMGRELKRHYMRERGLWLVGAEFLPT